MTIRNSTNLHSIHYNSKAVVNSFGELQMSTFVYYPPTPVVKNYVYIMLQITKAASTEAAFV